MCMKVCMHRCVYVRVLRIHMLCPWTSSPASMVVKLSAMASNL